MPSWISRAGLVLVTCPNRAPGSHAVVPRQKVFDVQELGLVEGVDQVRPQLQTRTATEVHAFREGDVPLVTSGKPKRRDGCCSVLTRRRWHERRGVEPEQARLVASTGVGDLIWPQHARETRFLRSHS